MPDTPDRYEIRNDLVSVPKGRDGWTTAVVYVVWDKQVNRTVSGPHRRLRDAKAAAWALIGK